MSKIIRKIKESTTKVKDSVKRLVIKSKYRSVSVREVLCNTRGDAGALDIALGVVVAVVLTVIVLTAMKTLFNVNILPSVTDKITGMFS